MGAPQPVRLTYSDLQQVPEDGQRYEIIDGRLYVTPAPATRHQRILVRFTQTVVAQADAMGTWLVAPCDVVLGDGTVVQPDALFVKKGRETFIIREMALHGPPDLVVEILSPGTAQRDRTVKYQAYAENGIQEYWLVDPETEVVTVHTLDGGVYGELCSVNGDRLILSSVLEDLDVLAHELFV